MPPAILVENLGKCYQVARTAERTPYRTLRESLANLVTAPMRRFRNAGSENEVEPFWALRDVNFEVQPGEVVGIIGRNGAGKSTLLKILSRITKPTTGRVELNGRVGSLLEVGTGFHPELTGRENIYLNGSILGMSRREIARRFDEIVSFAEVERFLDTPVKRYSSGMYVRLAFAVAAHLEPEILIVDEVLAVGDAQFQKKCLGKMSEVSHSGRTILFVSHNMAAVRSLCRRVIVLEDGNIKIDGEADHGVNTYLHHDSKRHTAKKTFSRPGGVSAWMRTARLTTPGDIPGVLYYGDTLRIEVDFEADPPSDLPQLGLVVSASDGIRVINANTHYQPPNSLTQPLREGTIVCELQPPLMVGYYTISLWFGTRHVDTHVVEDALRFEVRERDIWGSGKVAPIGASYCWCPAQFSVQSRE